MKGQNSRERDIEMKERTSLLEYYDVKSESKNIYHFRVGEKIFFKYDRTFEEFKTGERIYLKAGECAICTNRYTLLLKDTEVYITDDIVISDISSGGFMYLLRNQLHDNPELTDLERNERQEVLRSCEKIFEMLSIKEV